MKNVEEMVALNFVFCIIKLKNFNFNFSSSRKIHIWPAGSMIKINYGMFNYD